MSSNLQEGAVGAGSSMTSAAGGHHIFSSFPPSTHTSSAYGTTVQFGDSSSSWPMTPAQGSSGSTSMTRDKKH
ncbi:hypothetical protein M406DRAFT_324470 [Cryphonectria parasitica EP155]|uniref:Uncharacterized protein n=1 Tax=Cryphonectria parasitica (strain ATCC 38755 / EP155) TaxID=660469 RepID=A0A9P5CIH0_CRYP1|nr:uncharacterized protein M406DRAFT_324470 [Cryphonectria parasitica EP155]KAF3760714.1 hypothetical protein M406DRAFT_324470 [Cryphonectria parasitica EP155]